MHGDARSGLWLPLSGACGGTALEGHWEWERAARAGGCEVEDGSRSRYPLPSLESPSSLPCEPTSGFANSRNSRRRRREGAPPSSRLPPDRLHVSTSRSSTADFIRLHRHVSSLSAPPIHLYSILHPACTVDETGPHACICCASGRGEGCVWLALRNDTHLFATAAASIDLTE